MRLIDHTRIRVGSRVVRIRAETTLCAGEGRPLRRDGKRLYKHFLCTYSAFLASGIYDCDFRVHVLGRRKYVITNQHWTSGAP